jgi:hypothetical protein
MLKKKANHGECPHFSHLVRLLRVCFTGSWFQKAYGQQDPYLRPPDFFLWGFLKDSVYSNHPHTLEELQATIQHTVDGIWNEILKNGSITWFVMYTYVQTIMANTLNSFIIY